MSAPFDRRLDFEPRTRADRPRLRRLGAMSVVLWLLALAVTVVVFVHRDVIVTALLFTLACFAFSGLVLSLALVARRRRESLPTPLLDSIDPGERR